MWGLQYDENLTNNPFFREILSNHDDILKRASQDNWIICIPREGSFDPREISNELVLDHILVPGTGEFFFTLSKKQLAIKDKQILTADPSDAVKILFEETFYIQTLKYSVLCVEKPLFAPRLACDSPPILDTLDACIDFLHPEDLHRIQKLCSGFIEQNPTLQTENLQSQRDLVGRLYSQCLQAVLKNRLFAGDLADLKLAVETYMQSCLDDALIRAVNTLTCFRDSAFNKLVRNSGDLTLKDLNISNEFCDVIMKAKLELGKINDHVTVLDKTNCLKRTFAHLSTVCRTSDDVLQIFVFLILKLGVNNWHSNLLYLTRFQFSSANSSDENSFLVTTLEAAVEFITSPQFARPSPPAADPLFRAIQSDDLPLLRALLRRPLCHPLCDCCRRSCDSRDDLGRTLLAFAALLGRASAAQFLLAAGADARARDRRGRTPLHLACLAGAQDAALVLTTGDADVNAADDDGNTALHLACRNGHDACVKALLYASRRLDPNAVNALGETPLHLALRWNHVDAARTLLENGADAGVADNKGRLPADLAQNFHAEALFRPRAGRGRTKADLLLKAIEDDDLPLARFHLGLAGRGARAKCHPLCDCRECEGEDPADRVNACNEDGLTPLHLAAKFGRAELARILLESRALADAKTHKTLQTPLHLACIYRRARVVRELVDAGCEVDARDYRGKTALYYAWVKNDAEIVDILMNSGASCEELRTNKSGQVVK